MKQRIRDKEMKQVAKWAAQRGWRCTFSGKTHLRFSHPRGGLVFASGTPRNSDCAARATKRDIRKQEQQHG